MEHAHWIINDMERICSKCGFIYRLLKYKGNKPIYKYNFETCPNCKVRMDEEDK